MDRPSLGLLQSLTVVLRSVTQCTDEGLHAEKSPGQRKGEKRGRQNRFNLSMVDTLVGLHDFFFSAVNV